MHSDDAHNALLEIERWLRWESPELARLFDNEDPPAWESACRWNRVRTLLAAAAITGCLLLGPRMLTDAEIRRAGGPVSRVRTRGVMFSRDQSPSRVPTTWPSGVEEK